MSKINDEFMEAYKKIDIFCRDSLGTSTGVTTYIDEMRNISDGDSYVPGWKESLDCLVKYRHIRNNYSHEIGSSYSDICDWDDVLWLRHFYVKLLKVKDPLALYNHGKTSTYKKQKVIKVKTSNFYPEVEKVINEDKISKFSQEFDRINEGHQESKRSSPSIVILALIIIIALAVAALGIAYIVVF